MPAHRVEGQAGDCVLFTEKLSHGTVPWTGSGERRTLFCAPTNHLLRTTCNRGLLGLDLAAHIRQVRAVWNAPLGRGLRYDRSRVDVAAARYTGVLRQLV